MSLDPSGSSHRLDRAEGIRAESRSVAIHATRDDTPAIQGQLLCYIYNATKIFEQKQSSQAFFSYF